MTKKIAQKAHRRWLATLPRQILVAILECDADAARLFSDVLDDVLEEEAERISNIPDVGIRRAAMQATCSAEVGDCEPGDPR